MGEAKNIYFTCLKDMDVQTFKKRRLIDKIVATL